ncbi:MAG: DUF1361 domain-containing protein [Candidatus Caenarcaniphilales bacterium]|nr:DUF1361 domain-containing protein [Candidatus Caenarcaniphilales bacterium]
MNSDAERDLNQNLDLVKSLLMVSLIICFIPIARTLYLDQFKELLLYLTHKDWSLVKKVCKEHGLYLFLIWNLILAWVPLVLSTLLVSSKKFQETKNLAKYLPYLLWLIFYPNAPYVFTDFLHYAWHPTEGLLLWFDISMLFLFSLLGFLCAYVSLRQICSLLPKSLQKAFPYFILFLSSYGIYLGRFIRLNSWDLATNLPKVIITVLQSFTEAFTYQFTFLVFIFIALVYFLLDIFSQSTLIEMDK